MVSTGSPINGDVYALEGALGDCAMALKSWGRQTFGNIPKNVADLQRELTELNDST